MNNLRHDLVAAMQTAAPSLQLRDAVKKLLEQGLDRDNLRTELEALRKEVSQGEEDVILDVLDFLEGWCRPELKL